MLATWADKLPLKTVYVYGSRVRGDYTPDSDLDVAWDLMPMSEKLPNGAAGEWTTQHQTDFAAIKAAVRSALGVRLEFSDAQDEALLQRIRVATSEPVLAVRKVVCVYLPPRVDLIT